jgi:hypothetical protein
MAVLKWPYVAIGADGNEYTPAEAKQFNIKAKQTYHILGYEVIAKAGKVNQHHWASPTGIDYCAIRPGYEMSHWHYQQQIDAKNNGLQIEYKITKPDGSLYFADAYDSSTNTVIEYVWSHFDAAKVEDYFNLGYNQQWVFAMAQFNKIDRYCNFVRRSNWEESYNGEAKNLLPNLNLPTIKGFYV